MEFGRRVPTDFVHIEKYGIALVQPETVEHVEKILKLPTQYRVRYDQGQEGACVGFGSSWSQSIRNNMFYDARWLYQQAQLVDEWAETPPEEGTSVRAAYDVLRDIGHRRLLRGKSLPPVREYGIIANRWATSVDEMRTAIANDNPVTIGVNWYRDFSNPTHVGYHNDWIGRNIYRLGPLDGGHCVCVYGASDKRQAFKLVNNWGPSYPLVWIPYDTMQLLLNQYGEATIITDY